MDIREPNKSKPATFTRNDRLVCFCIGKLCRRRPITIIGRSLRLLLYSLYRYRPTATTRSDLFGCVYAAAGEEFPRRSHLHILVQLPALSRFRLRSMAPRSDLINDITFDGPGECEGESADFLASLLHSNLMRHTYLPSFGAQRTSVAPYIILAHICVVTNTARFTSIS